MRRQYMSEDEFNDISGRELGRVGAWRILEAPPDWNDRYLWATDGYWLAPVCARNEAGFPVADIMRADEFAEIVAHQEEYCLQTRPGHRFDWSRAGQVDASNAYRIPRSARTRGATLPV